jgi:hypothetical protein
MRVSPGSRSSFWKLAYISDALPSYQSPHHMRSDQGLQEMKYVKATYKKSAAAGGEHTIAGEQRTAAAVHHVTGGMARRFHHSEREFA